MVKYVIITPLTEKEIHLRTINIMWQMGIELPYPTDDVEHRNYVIELYNTISNKVKTTGLIGTDLYIAAKMSDNAKAKIILNHLWHTKYMAHKFRLLDGKVFSIKYNVVKQKNFLKFSPQYIIPSILDTLDEFAFVIRKAFYKLIGFKSPYA